MTETTKVRKQGGSLALILPKAVAEAMALHEGDELFITRTAEGLIVTPYDPDFADAMANARRFMHTHRNTFRELAK